MLDLVIFAFEIFQDCRLLDNIISKLVPFHVSVAVDVNLLEEIGEIANKPSLSIRKLYLPKFEVFSSDIDKLWQIKGKILALELFLEHANSELIKI
jgi:hypothetical protein